MSFVRCLQIRRKPISLFMISGLAMVPACVRGRPASLQFSPDSSTVAYIWGSAVAHPIGAEYRRFSQTVSIRWCRAGTPEARRSITIDTAGSDYAGTDIAEEFTFFKFSPDSRHLVVVSRGRAFCVNLDSAEHWLLTAEDEFVTSIAWLGSGEVAYCSFDNIGDLYKEFRGPSDRGFHRQQIHDPAEKRTTIYSERAIAVERGFETFRSWVGHRAFEYWSPQGRQVIFVSPRRRGGFKILEIETGKTAHFGASAGIPVGVSWKRDGTSALCLSTLFPSRETPVEVLLLDAATGATIDLGKEFFAAVGPIDMFLGSEVPALWTADGEFFIVNDSFSNGGYLISPRPWRVLPVGQTLAKRLVPLPQWYGSIPVYPLPIAGWVQALATDKECAFNYRDNRLVELGKPSPAGIAVSPDGTKVATIDKNGKVTVRNMDLGKRPHASESQGE